MFDCLWLIDFNFVVGYELTHSVPETNCTKLTQHNFATVGYVTESCSFQQNVQKEIVYTTNCIILRSKPAHLINTRLLRLTL